MNRPSPARRRRAITQTTTRSGLLEAAAIGGAVARADLAGDAAAAAEAFTAWRQLRRRTNRQSRQLLRVAFDTGYGQAMSPALATGR